MIKPHDSLIVRKISLLMVPMIQLFAFYVFFHGHHSPGGGFQAGVLIGASIILKLLVLTRVERTAFSIRRELLIATLGLAIYTAAGALALPSGLNYLNYEYLSILSPEVAMRRFYGIMIIESGVVLVVAMILVIIFHQLALTNEHLTRRQDEPV